MFLPKQSVYNFFHRKQTQNFFDEEMFYKHAELQQQRSMVTHTLQKATAFVLQVQYQQLPLKSTELSHILNILACFQQISSLLLFFPSHSGLASQLVLGLESLSELTKNFGEEVSHSTIAINASISLMKVALLGEDSEIRSQQIRDVVTTLEMLDQQSVALLLCDAYLVQLLDSSTEYLETNVKKMISLGSNIDSESSSIYCDILYQTFQVTNQFELLDAAQKTMVCADVVNIPAELYGKIARLYFEVVLLNPPERLTKAYELGRFLLDNQIQMDSETIGPWMEIQSKYARHLIKQFWLADMKTKSNHEASIGPVMQQLELSASCLPPQDALYFAAELQELKCLFQPDTTRWAAVADAYLKCSNIATPQQRKSS